MDAEDELARGFFFLTSQEILDRFGVPNQISVTSGGEQLWRFDGPEAGPSYRLFFRFHEGRLIRMQ
jgi:hypothetical protein